MKKIYIILSQSGTLFSKAIRCYTKDPYNHASIAFDANLNVMYSFGRKTRYNMLNNGFIEENLSHGLYSFFPNARCCIFEVPVTDEEYDAMYQLLSHFCYNAESYRYNFMGVLTYAFGKGLKRKDHYFCSQFVSQLMGKVESWNYIPELTKPMDFYYIKNKRIIFEGTIKEFNELQYNIIT